MLKTIWNGLEGVKTYLICAATVAWGAFGYWDHLIDMPTALGFIFGGAGFGALRHGVGTGIVALGEQFAPMILDAISKVPPPAPIVALAPELAMVQKVVAAAVAAGHDPATIGTVAASAMPPTSPQPPSAPVPGAAAPAG